MSEPASTGGSRFPAPSISKRQYGIPDPAPVPSSPQEPVSIQGLIAYQPVVRRIQWQSLAGFLYLAVAVALTLRVIFGLAAASRLWFGAQPVFFDEEWGSFPRLHLRSSAAIASPVTIGSAVLLPADYTEWDAEKLRIVLAHERSHIRQGDFYLQLLAAVYAALFWFSPLGWWLKNKLRNLGEAIGDHAALNQAASPASYARLLLEFAALPRPTLIGVDMARPSTISQRIERLLNDSAFRQAFAGGAATCLACSAGRPCRDLCCDCGGSGGSGRSRADSSSIAGCAGGSSKLLAHPPPRRRQQRRRRPLRRTQRRRLLMPHSDWACFWGRFGISAHSPQAPAVPGKAGQPDTPNPPELLIQTDGPDSPDEMKFIILRDQARIQAQVKAQVDSQVKAQADAQVKAQVNAQAIAQVKAQVDAQVKAQLQAMVANKYLQDARIYQLKGADGGTLELLLRNVERRRFLRHRLRA